MSSTDPKKMIRVHRPVRGDCVSSLGPLPPSIWAGTETECEIAAPRLDGPQHAPSLTRTGSPECEWKRGETTLFTPDRFPPLPAIQMRSP